MKTVSIDPVTVALWEYQGREKNLMPRRWTRGDIELMVERVNRGAAHLDQKEAGWNYRVVPENLDMSDGNLCIVGQAVGAYGRWVGPVFGMAMNVDDEIVDRLAVDHGFLTKEREEFYNYDEDTDEDCPDGECIPWELMDRVWVYLLQTRAMEKDAIFLELPPQEDLKVQKQRLINNKLLPV